jgi:hypothetical protein
MLSVYLHPKVITLSGFHCIIKDGLNLLGRRRVNHLASSDDRISHSSGSGKISGLRIHRLQKAEK